jgi:hypothetical protein
VAKGFGLELEAVDSVGAQIALVAMGSVFLGFGIWLLKSPGQGLGVAALVLVIGLFGVGVTELLAPDGPVVDGNDGSTTSTTDGSLSSTTFVTPPPPETGEWETSATGTEDGLTLSVLRVRIESGGQATLTVAVDNKTGDSLNLPLFGNFSASTATGQTISADPFASEWPDSFPSGTELQGQIRLETWFSSGAEEFRIDFSQVFGSFELDSISVQGIPIRG